MSQLQEQKNALGQEFHIFSLLRFALPSILMMIFMGLYTTIDTVFAARFIHTDALSALNIVTPIINVIVGLGAMLATGGSAIVASKLGAEEPERARKDFTLLFLTAAAAGLLIAAAGHLMIDPLIRRLGASKNLFPYCKAYLSTLLFFIPASMLQILFQSFLVTAGKPGLGMLLSIAAGIANIILDYCFIVLLKMGIAGSALGTGIGYLIPAITGALFFTFQKGPLKFSHPVWDRTVLSQACFNGSSEMVSQIAAAVTTFLFNRTMMKLLGEDGIAAITIIIYTQFFLTTLYIGFSMGVAPVLSYNHGGSHTMRQKRIFRFCLMFIAAVSLLVFTSALIFGPALVSIFAPRHTEVYRIAQKGFWIFSFSFLFCGFNIFTSAAFTAFSNGTLSALLSFLRTFGLITTALLVLPHFGGETGVWLAVPCAEFLTFFASIFLLWKNRQRYHYL